MDWLSRLLRLAFEIRITTQRKTIIRMTKVNTADLEVCRPKLILRERPFWRKDQIDSYPLLPDGTIRHTPGD